MRYRRWITREGHRSPRSRLHPTTGNGIRAMISICQRCGGLYDPSGEPYAGRQCKCGVPKDGECIWCDGNGIIELRCPKCDGSGRKPDFMKFSDILSRVARCLIFCLTISENFLNFRNCRPILSFDRSPKKICVDLQKPTGKQSKMNSNASLVL